MAQKRYYKITSGAGASNYELVAFDSALQDAGIADYNLIKISSILPAGAHVEPEIGAEKGSIIPTAYATVSDNRCNTFLQTGVAIGIPEDDKVVGVIMEDSNVWERLSGLPVGELDRFLNGVNKSFREKLIERVKLAMENRARKIARIEFSTASCYIANNHLISEPRGSNYLYLNLGTGCHRTIITPYDGNYHSLVSAVCLW